MIFILTFNQIKVVTIKMLHTIVNNIVKILTAIQFVKKINDVVIKKYYMKEQIMILFKLHKYQLIMEFKMK